MTDVTQPDSYWQRIWFATRQNPWTSLAVVPCDAGINAAEVAEALAQIGRVHGEKTVSVLDATGVQLARVQHVIERLGTMTSRGDWVIVPVDPLTDNAGCVPIVQATSAAVLVVRLGNSLLASARHTIDLVGRGRFLGSVVVGGGAAEQTGLLHLGVVATGLLLHPIFQ